jgi:hypothetical protein
MSETLCAQLELEAIGLQVDPMDQRLDDSGSLGWEQLFPERVEPVEGFSDRILGELGPLNLSRPPRGHDDLR